MIAATLVLIALVLLYYYNTRTFSYWKDRGVKHDSPIVLVGNNLQNYLMQKSVTEIAVETYQKYPNEKIVGFFRSTRPELVIRDPDIIKRCLITDFNCFYSKGLNTHRTVIEPMMRNLFFADGDLWRLLRQRMTSAFTGSKVRAMFPMIVKCAERLQERARSAEPHVVDARDLMARYTMDFIGSCGFGIQVDSMSNEASAFWKLGCEIFEISFTHAVMIGLKELFPHTCAHWKILGNIEKDLINLVNEIQKQRNYKPSERNDFIDLLIEIKQKGKMVGESIEKCKPDGTPEQVVIELDENLIAAQVLAFLAAGFETTSLAISYTLHMLAFHTEVQTKVQKEIDEVLAKYNNKLKYEAIAEMTYLEWTFKEAMRMFPSVGFLMRESARKYTIPELNVALDEHVRVLIPVAALHNDPLFWRKPEEFRPERFHPDEFDSTQKKVYLPFGAGPRTCIGVRLGMMESLAGLAAVLYRVTVSPAPKTVRQPQVEPAFTIIQRIRGGLPLIFKDREQHNAS